MSLYNLISTGSGEIVNIFAWDGISEIYIPSGFTTSLNTTESIQMPYVFSSGSVPTSEFTEQYSDDFFGSVYSDKIETSRIFTEKISSNELIQFGEAIFGGTIQVTGSMDVSGSLLIGGKKIEELLNTGKYGTIMYNSSIFTNECPYPLTFRVNNSENNPFEPGSWTNNSAPVTKLSICTNNLSEEINGQIVPVESYVNRRQFLYDIVFNGYLDSRISLRSTDVENTIKRFLVKGGTYYRADITPGSFGLFPAIINFVEYFEFGSQEVKITTAQEIYDKFNTILINRPGTYSYLEYFELDVVEYYSNFYPDEPGAIKPQSYTLDFGQKFFFDGEIVIPSKRKEVYVIETSQEFTIPSWVNKTTIYTIGAGGGGGGGTAGFMHSDNLPIHKSGWSGFYFIDGLPNSFGHELLSGGGGGAGGNVSVAEFDSADIPPGSVLQLIVGSGGLGGSGYGFANSDNTDIDLIRMVTNIQNPNDSYADVRNNRDVFETLSNFLQIPQLYKWFNEPESSLRLGSGFYYEINKFLEKNDGKRGGFSAAILKSIPTNPNVMQTMVQADGGLGGRAGLGIRSYFMDDQFRLMTSNKFTRTEDCIDCETTYLNQYWVPGGGSTIGSSFSPQNTVYLGGPGGYGITMASVRADYDIKVLGINTYATRQDYGKIVTTTLKRNTAPPQKWEENTELPDLKLPYGDPGLKRQSPETMQKSSYPAPTGGGGGAGKVMFAMENRLLSEEGTKYSGYFISDDPTIISSRPIYTKYSLDRIDGRPINSQRPNENIGFPNDTIFDDYYKNFAIKINMATTLGEGGKFISSNILFDDNDSNGVRHTVLLGRGGNGGYDVSNNPHASLAGFTSNVLPSNGSGDLVNGFGGGGGGGAARFTPNVYYDGGDLSTVGQDGADGGNGVVIIVIES